MLEHKLASLEDVKINLHDLDLIIYKKQVFSWPFFNFLLETAITNMPVHNI